MAGTESAHQGNLNPSWSAIITKSLGKARSYAFIKLPGQEHSRYLGLTLLAIIALGWTLHNATTTKQAALHSAVETLDLLSQTTIARLATSQIKFADSANDSSTADYQGWLSQNLPPLASNMGRSAILADRRGIIRATTSNFPISAGDDLFSTLDPIQLTALIEGNSPSLHINLGEAGSHLISLRTVPHHGLLLILQNEYTALASWRNNTAYTLVLLLMISLLFIPMRSPRNNAKAEQATTDEAAHTRLLDAIETISEAFVLWNEDKQLVICNSKFKIFHRLPDEVVTPGTPYSDILAAAKAPCLGQGLLSANDDSCLARTYEAKLANGRWLQINERRTKDGGYVSVGTDITVVKRSQRRITHREQELRATVEDLSKSRRTHERQAQQLVELAEKYMREKTRAEDANRAKSEFLANISHELRTPLNAVIGFSDVMQHGLFGPMGNEKYEEYSRDIHQSGKHLLDVINDVLDMSKIEAGRMALQPSQVNLGEIIDDCLRIVSQAAEDQNIKLERTGLEDITFTADKRALKQVVINLLSNAIKFTPEEGKVSIKITKQRGQAHISITDTGIGIPPKDIIKLGRPFEQVENQFTKTHKGSGLGLAISRSLIELHHGELQIRSKVGEGTTVTCRLPLIAREEQLDLLTSAQEKTTVYAAA